MGEPMRALSVMQPWIGAITYSDKRVENRGWPAPDWIIGRTIALHASKGPDWGAPDRAWTACGLAPYRAGPNAPRRAWTASLTLGAVLAVATITGCHHSMDCRCHHDEGPRERGSLCTPWSASGQFHWVLAGVRPLAEPLPCRGALGLWRLPGDVEKLVREQMEVPGA
jgi:hypothetical protein